jgi:hypothetical protein
MRLINVKTLELEKFLDSNLPPYAILSHTWKDDEELTLHDIEGGRTNKPGIGSIKLRNSCRLAEPLQRRERFWLSALKMEQRKLFN